MAESDINDFCRLCNENCRKQGRLTGTKKIYQRGGSDNQSVFLRLASYGLRLQPQDDKSIRICRKCVVKIEAVEASLSVLSKWKLGEETPSEPAATSTPKATPPQTDSEKRPRASPFKMPRVPRKRKHHPSTPTHKPTPLKTSGKVTGQSVVEDSGGSIYHILPSVRHVSTQTEPPERKSVGTQLSMKTLSNHIRSTATQAKAPSRDCGVCTLTFPLDSPILFLQPTIVKRPSKRPRLSHTDEEEGPSE